MLAGGFRLLGDDLQHGPDGAGGDAVHADLSLLQTLRERFGEGVDSAFGGGVVEQVLAALQSGFRAGVDDCAAFGQMLEGGLDHIEVSEDVGAEGFLELFVGEVFNLGDVLLERSIVYEDVEFA